MEYLVRLVTPPNGIVLDPFFGTGTTGIACLKQGFRFIGIEIDEIYCKIAEHRLRPYLTQQRLTAGIVPDLGSDTTALAGVEINRNYDKVAHRRIKSQATQMTIEDLL
jgi:site-specific DNA-methyltransferase (adenine-specific)